MKMRNVLVRCVGTLLFAVCSAQAQFPPQHGVLPNYDKRRDAGAGAVSARPASAGLVAEANLTARIPGARVDRDRVLGTPRFIGASRGFLSGPGGVGLAVSSQSAQAFPAADPHRAVKAFVNEHAGLFGFDAGVLAAANIRRDYVTEHNGVRTVIWQEALLGIEVFDGLFTSHITRNGELVSVSSMFVPDPAGAAQRGQAGRETAVVNSPPVTAGAAVSLAAANLGGSVNTAELTVVSSGAGSEKRQSFSGAGLRGSAEARLVWMPLSGDSLRLAWWVILASTARPETYSLVVDAETGEVLIRRCLTSYAASFSYRVFTSDSPSPMSPGLQVPGSTQPPIVQRNLVTLSNLNATASPIGWIDTGNQTLGNNVDAHLDRNDDDLADLPRPNADTNNVFDFALSLSNAPSTYGNAAVVNLFYWNNFMHDKLYELGFTEAAGNFQLTNFARGGVGRDAVQADAQDGAALGDFLHVNNANFSTLPDGFPGRMQMYLFNGPAPDRDGSLDADVMLHEYTHGLSNRLLGGGVGIFQLQPAGMGEGWSDFYALALLSEAGDDPRACYAAGGYASYVFSGLLFDQNYYFGIRRYPYTTDILKNPLTLKDIDPTKADPHPGIPISPIFSGSTADEVHAMGEVWCVTLWEARANLIEKLGYDAGNRLILQLVTDGMKLAPANATYLEARDAILKADELLTGGDSLVELWTAFAKRGMGLSASVPPSDAFNGTVGVIEAFDLPGDIFTGVEDAIFEIRITPTPGSVIVGGTNTPIFVRVTDGPSVTNATVTATVVGAPAVVFRNDGQPPDFAANNSTYSANLAPPLTSSSVVLTLVISATNKLTTTNVFSYTVVPPPPNDHFTNAIKVASSGANYISNNRTATTETNEPVHAGVLSSAKSLWWNYTSPTNTTLLIDTAGSAFNTIIAVYTNQTLATLKPVVSVDDVNGRNQAFVQLSVAAGVTYRVAIAGYDANANGSLLVNFQPNGQPDTNAPVVTVTAPLDGTTVTTNRVVLTGIAVDPDPNPSGIQDIFIQVNSVLQGAQSKVPTGEASFFSTNWTRVVSLRNGLNDIRITTIDRAGNPSAAVHLSVNYLEQDPPNDFLVLAADLTAKPEVTSGNNAKASKEVGEPNHAGNAGGKSVWWDYFAPGDGLLTLNTTNSSFDTLLAVYTGPRANALTLIAGNDDAYAGVPGGSSQIIQAVRGGQIYHIAVDGYDGAAGTVFLHYAFVPAKVYHVTASSTGGGAVAPAFADAAEGSTVMFSALPDANHALDLWGGDVLSANNPLTVVVRTNLNITAIFRAIPVSEDFEAGNLLQLPWATSVNAPWQVQTNVASSGTFAARSGAMTDNHTSPQSSSLFLTGNFRAGAGTFDYRVSSEPGFDTFGFYLDGVLQRQPPWSGDLAWTSFVFPLAAGTHTLEWRYVKDANGSVGLDAAFLDNVNLPFVVAVNGSSPANLRLFRQSDGGVFIEVGGQTNQYYITQVSTNLANWQNLSTNIAFDGLIRVADPGSSTNSVRFYRAVVAP